MTALTTLAAQNQIAADDLSALDAVTARYAMALTGEVEALIAADPSGPVARQFLPSLAELETTATERTDPIGDDAHSPVRGIVHRHPDRVLFKIANVCPVYCRFCFRREMIGPNSETALDAAAMDAAFAYIAAHPEIHEVILTGGDPFVLSTRRIAAITVRLAAITHVKIARWHSRVPLIDPGRVDEGFVSALTTDGLVPFVALHANHADEFTAAARASIARLVDAGIPLLSQTVLLRGINDDVDTLAALMNAFVENRVKPYYLHHPDLAPGTGHFRISIAEGQALMRALRAKISGIAIPQYVLDIPGGYAKVPLLSDDVVTLEDGRYRIRDHAGRWHLYPPA
jgi:lysine 2,3-aminomutase